MKFFSFCLCLVAYSFTYAGNEVGNGGDVIVCKTKTGKIESIELLDFYEAKTMTNLEIKTLNSKASPLSQVKSVLERLKKHHPKLAKQYLKRSQSFFKEVSFIKNAQLTNIEDSLQLVHPTKKNCHTQQIAILKKKHKSSKNFLIDKRLWNKMDNTHKAGLILHEIIYEHLAFAGEKNSVKARQLNSMFFSNRLDNMNTKQYWAKIKDLEVPIYREL